MSQSQCPACKGTGYIRIGLTTQPCEECGTRGHITDEKQSTQPTDDKVHSDLNHK